MHNYKDKMAINIYLPVINLPINGLTVPIKKHKLSEQIRKKKTTLYMLSIRDPPKNKTP